MLLGITQGSRGDTDHAADIRAAHETEYEQIALHIKDLSPSHAGYARLRAEALSSEALS